VQPSPAWLVAADSEPDDVPRPRGNRRRTIAKEKAKKAENKAERKEKKAEKAAKEDAQKKEKAAESKAKTKERADKQVAQEATSKEQSAKAQERSAKQQEQAAKEREAKKPVYGACSCTVGLYNDNYFRGSLLSQKTTTSYVGGWVPSGRLSVHSIKISNGCLFVRTCHDLDLECVRRALLLHKCSQVLTEACYATIRLPVGEDEKQNRFFATFR